MNGPLFMGIDGGGSKLRIVIVNADLRPLCSIVSKAVNPNTVGRGTAQAVIRRGIADALDQAGVQPRDIAALAIGIAGASNLHSEDWLIETVRPALPETLLMPSSDLEIALVGALGRQHGILLLAGTGSAVYGCAQDGQRLQVGGWGYLLGDDGSGYWLGLQLLRRVTAQFDESLSSQDDALTRICLNALELETPRDLIAWLYRADETPPKRIANLAELVLKLAANDIRAPDSSGKWAKDVVDAAAEHLARQVNLMRSRLGWPGASVGFAGGLLDNDNLLSQRVSGKLGLPARPVAKHSPVLGAALLAKMKWSAK